MDPKQQIIKEAEQNIEQLKNIKEKVQVKQDALQKKKPTTFHTPSLVYNNGTNLTIRVGEILHFTLAAESQQGQKYRFHGAWKLDGELFPIIGEYSSSSTVGATGKTRYSYKPSKKGKAIFDEHKQIIMAEAIPFIQDNLKEIKQKHTEQKNLSAYKTKRETIQKILYSINREINIKQQLIEYLKCANQTENFLHQLKEI